MEASTATKRGRSLVDRFFCKMLDLLPTEILQLVTSNLNGIYIGLLWLCGNTRLNKRMGDERGVIHFEVSAKFCAWPTLVDRFLHLESFRFIPEPFHENLPAWTPAGCHFSDLGMKLNSLDLSGLKDSDSFLDFMLGSRDCFPLLKYFKSGHGLTQVSYDVFEDLPNIEHLIGPLFTMVILSPVSLPLCLRELEIRVMLLDLSRGFYFPESLESLSLTFESCLGHNHNPWIFFSGLPVGLTDLSAFCIGSLHAPRQKPTSKDIMLLPRGLKSFSTLLDEDLPSPEFLRALPRNLTKLSLNLTGPLEEYWRDNDYAALKALPRTLLSMESDEECFKTGVEITKETVDFFPPGLFCNNPWTTWDDMRPTDDAITVTLSKKPLDEENQAMKLPDSVTAVRTHSSDYINMHMLPASLTHLTVIMSEEWTPIERFEHLPKSLRALSIDCSAELAYFPVELLPTHVQELTFYNRYPNWHTTIEDCGAMSRNLRSLKLFYVGLADPERAWSLLPPKLEELSITGESLPLGCAEALPKMSLQKLFLAFSVDPSRQLSHHILMALPQSLTTLTLIDDSPGADNITYRSVLNLPPGLTRFELRWPTLPSRAFELNMDVLRLIFKRGLTWFGTNRRPNVIPY